MWAFAWRGTDDMARIIIIALLVIGALLLWRSWRNKR